MAEQMSNRVAALTGREEFEPKNRLLAELPGMELLYLRPHLEPVGLTRGSVLVEGDAPLTRVYFVETGIISQVSLLESRSCVGVAMVGREGFVGMAAMLGSHTTLGRHLVHIPGSALALDVSRLRGVLRASPKLRGACESYAQALFIQVLQAVACNRLHSVKQRCARWLLMCADRMEDDTLELSQESLAEMLGVPGPAAAAAGRALQAAGLIRHRRSAIAVLDRPGLEAAACQCYRTLRDRNRRLFGRAFG